MRIFINQTGFSARPGKTLPADLSAPRLGKRALDVLDDMANAGDKKYMLGEADLFKIEPDYELYGHMNINYLQLDKMPEFKDGWQPVLDAMEKGKFFVTTGEVLLPTFTVNGKKPGKQLPWQAMVKPILYWKPTGLSRLILQKLFRAMANKFTAKPLT